MASMLSRNSSPTMPIGIIDSSSFSTNACSALKCRENTPRSSLHISRHNTTIVLSTVAACSVMSNVRFSAISTPISSLASCRWPLLDTGRNSVSPCTAPSIIASSVSMLRYWVSGRYRFRPPSASKRLSMAYISNTKPAMTTTGASDILRHEKIE